MPSMRLLEINLNKLPEREIVYRTPPPNYSTESNRLHKLYNECVAGELKKPEVKIVPWPDGLLGVDDVDWIRPGTQLPGKLFRAYVEEEKNE